MNELRDLKAAPGALRRSNAKPRRGRWIPWAGAVLLAGMLTAGFWPRPVPVETARVVVGTLRSTVDEEGKTRIRQRYRVAAPVPGQLRRIELKAGAEVMAHETVLAVIDPSAPAPLDARSRSLAEARRASAIALLEKARAANAFAAAERRRFEGLYQNQTISIQEFEGVKLREQSAARDEAAAASALSEAEAQLAEFGASGAAAPSPVEVKAAVSGRVLKVFEESARTIAAGAPLLEIGDPGDLEVVVEVLSRDGASIRTGAAVEFDQWGGGAPLTGRVRLVEPAAFTKVSALGVEEQRVNVIADLLSPANERRSLGDNFRVDAHITVWEAPEALKVPAGALFRRGNDWAAFLLRHGRAELRLVKIGRASSTEVQVTEGLRAGDLVIVYPGSRVKDGLRVIPITI